MMRHTSTPEIGARFVGIALGHVTREYPNRPKYTLAGPEDIRPPSEVHPVFYGSYDWHFCVHSYWLLARLLRLFPAAPQANANRAPFDKQLVPEKVAGKCAYLAAPTARGFKRPNGWAWLLKLANELAGLPDPRWSKALEPLTKIFAQRFRNFLPVASYPVRVGTHFNTAFALRMAADHAEGTGDAALLDLLLHTAERWCSEDVDCPAWGEPGGDDFQSSALIEAECMRRLLPASRFLPRLAKRRPATIFQPAVATDRSDGKIAHLDGLNLSRTWCFRALAKALPVTDDRRSVMEDAATAHLAASLPHIDTAPPLTRRLRVAVAAWSSGVRLGTRVFRDQAHLREMDPRLLVDVGLTREDVARGAFRPGRDR